MGTKRALKKAAGKDSARSKEFAKKSGKRLLKRISATDDAADDISVTPPRNDEETDAKDDADDDYEEEEDEDEGDEDDDAEDEDAADETLNRSKEHAKQARGKKHKAAQLPAVKVAMKRKGSGAEARMTKILKTMMAAMGASCSRAEDGELAKGKVATPEDWLTDKVKKTARKMCKERIAKRTMFPAVGDMTAAAKRAFNLEMPDMSAPPSAMPDPMNTCMSKQVRGDLPKRVKAAIASTEYKDVPEGDFADELKGSAYRTGPDGAYSDARFLQVLERTFYKDGLPADGVMHLTAAELAFAELGVYWIVFMKNPSYPKDDNTGHVGRRAYEAFLAEAQKGVAEKHVSVPARGAGAGARAAKKKHRKEL